MRKTLRIMRVSSSLSLSLSLSLSSVHIFFIVVLLREVCCKHEHDVAARRGGDADRHVRQTGRTRERGRPGGREVAKGVLALQWGNLP